LDKKKCWGWGHRTKTRDTGMKKNKLRGETERKNIQPGQRTGTKMSGRETNKTSRSGENAIREKEELGSEEDFQSKRANCESLQTSKTKSARNEKVDKKAQ